jgi:hypothetical protein
MSSGISERSIPGASFTPVGFCNATFHTQVSEGDQSFGSDNRRVEFLLAGSIQTFCQPTHIGTRIARVLMRSLQLLALE